jgi:hypothetical protein
VKAGAGAALRRMSTDHLAIDVAGDINVTAPDMSALSSAALFAGDGVEVIEPQELRQEIMESLTRVRDLHSEPAHEHSNVGRAPVPNALSGSVAHVSRWRHHR